VLQVAPNVTILPMRVLGPDGSGDVDDVVAAVDHAIAMGADIVNLSLGTHANLPALETMMLYAASQQVLVTASAGNSGDENVTYPAAYDFFWKDSEYTIGVGSVDLEERKSTFSTYGEALEISAPGELIYTLAPDSQIAYWSGTSMAAPIVAGAAALGLAEATTQVQIDDMPWYLLQEADLLDRFNKDYRHQLGWGRLNVFNFIEMGFSW
jgi:subtilisin family serine protease